MTKPTLQTLKGFRDFLPDDVRKREFVAERIKQTFERFGFGPLETPTLEYASVLLGKYGDEADKLVYQFVDNGDREVALRYDQTVPTARVLAQYQHELPRYFRRYQMQNVFRAEKPQKGRYREFRQCDIDIFGSTAAVADAEVVACAYAAYRAIGFAQVEVRINDRQTLLSNLTPFATDTVSVFSLVQSVDKLDKMSPADIASELVRKGLQQSQAERALEAIQKAEISSQLQEIVDIAVSLGVARDDLKITPTLARGLDYYTGMIFEVVIPEYPVGSCGGGGRYDNLIAQLGGVSTPAVGMAFGFDRTVEAAAALNLIPTALSGPQVLVGIFSPELLPQAASTAAALRQAGVATELYPSPDDALSKQYKTAAQKNIPWVALVGEQEAATNQISLKNMRDGSQATVSLEEALARLA